MNLHSESVLTHLLPFSDFSFISSSLADLGLRPLFSKYFLVDNVVLGLWGYIFLWRIALNICKQLIKIKNCVFEGYWSD